VTDPAAIIVWRFEDAPADLGALSRHGGDEDWLAVVPRALCDEPPDVWPLEDHNGEEYGDHYFPLPEWMWQGPFGVRRVSVTPHPSSAAHVVAIGAHA
jgi:hypothetical protein